MEGIIELQNINARWKDFSLKDVNISLPKGYIIELLGKNGAGKTTLLNILSNQISNYEGIARIAGYDCKTEELQVKDRAAFLSEEKNYFMEWNARENGAMYEPYFTKWSNQDFLSHLKKLEVPVNLPLKALSKGQFMRFQLAFAIAHHPELYVMDEPVAGLDPVFRKEFVSLLQELVEQEEATIFLSTHISSDLDSIVDYIVFMEEGEIRFVKDREEMICELREKVDEEQLHTRNLF